jgi:hypothetical protein
VAVELARRRWWVNSLVKVRERIGPALASPAARAQAPAKRIEQFDPALEKIMITSSPCQRAARMSGNVACLCPAHHREVHVVRRAPELIAALRAVRDTSSGDRAASQVAAICAIIDN